MSNLTDEVRKKIVGALPDVLAKALTDYQQFLDKTKKETAETPQEFKARHDACKAALGHIALIVKLAQQVMAGDDGAGDPNQKIVLEALLADARQELENYEKNPE